ncbi:hypothetical protein E4631_24635 [Hymenobacter sp. UV11]|nr:hypothetical protein E4631_24635 [Hymenobacter sp. UV11]
MARSDGAQPNLGGRYHLPGLAALGGHLGRKGDGPPGWQTLWLGRRSLRLLVEGVNIAAQLLDD